MDTGRTYGYGKGTAGRGRRVSPLRFRRAVEGYFRSISHEEPAGSEDAYGRPVMKTVYGLPPTIPGLCLHLGISRAAWEDCACGADAALAAVCEQAELRIEAYLETELLTREKGLQGVTQSLEERRLAREERARRRERGNAEESLTMDEKIALIRRAAEAFGMAPRGEETSPGAADG